MLSKCLGEMQLVAVTALIGHSFYGQIGRPQQFGGAGKSLPDNKFLRRAAHHRFEAAAKINAIQLAESRYLVYCQFTMIILLNVNDRFMDVIVLLDILILISPVCGVFSKLAQKKKELPNQMERIPLRVL